MTAEVIVRAFGKQETGAPSAKGSVKRHPTNKEVIPALRRMHIAYTNPTTFEPGSLVISKNLTPEFNRMTQSDLVVGVVLRNCPNLFQVTGEVVHWEAPGVLVGFLYGACLEEDWHPAWHFETYTGQMPDSH